MSADPLQLPVWLTPVLQAALVGAVGLLVASVRAVRKAADDIREVLARMHVTVYGTEGTAGLTATSAEHARSLTELRVWRAEIDTERRLQHPHGRRADDHDA